MRQNEGEDYWNKQTQTGLHDYQEYKNYMQIITDIYNQSTSVGVHTLQVMYCCELKDYDTTQGNYEFGYDGEDFISFHMNTLSWTAANPQAKIMKNQWDCDRAKAEYWKTYLENECIEQLKKYLIYGKNSLEKRDAPQMSLLQKDSSTLICQATGFYPRNILMTWRKNQEELYEDVDVGFTLPNDDGSYQKSISLSVKPEEWKKNSEAYRCVVQHVGEEKVVLLNEKKIKSNSASGINFIHLLVIATSVLVGCVLTVFVAIKLHTVGRKTRERLNRSEDDPRITCKDVTGSVGEKLNLTCRISYQEPCCYIKIYKFIAESDQKICQEELRTNHCLEMDSFSCSYTAEAAMTTKFKFFLQTNCGGKMPVFTVNVTEKNSTEIVYVKIQKEVIVAAGCVLVLIVFAAIMGVILWMRSRQSKRDYMTTKCLHSDSVSGQEMQCRSCSMEAIPNF